MLSQGPFSPRLHGLAEYLLGGFFIAAPFIFGFESDAAVAIAVVGGVALMLMAATSSTGPSLGGVVPVGLHVLFDVLLAGFLIAAPFIFGFDSEMSEVVNYARLVNEWMKAGGRAQLAAMLGISGSEQPARE